MDIFFYISICGDEKKLFKKKGGAMRPTWNESFFEIVKSYEKRSTCINFQVGAIFVRDNRILSAGYNGVPKKEPHCLESGCQKELGQLWCSGAHAEINAICNAAQEGISLANSVLYCTYSPCMSCAKQLVNLGIVKLFYKKRYIKKNGEGNAALALLERAGVSIIYLNENN